MKMDPQGYIDKMIPQDWEMVREIYQEGLETQNASFELEAAFLGGMGQEASSGMPAGLPGWKPSIRVGGAFADLGALGLPWVWPR